MPVRACLDASINPFVSWERMMRPIAALRPGARDLACNVVMFLEAAGDVHVRLRTFSKIRNEPKNRRSFPLVTHPSSLFATLLACAAALSRIGDEFAERLPTCAIERVAIAPVDPLPSSVRSRDTRLPLP
jgi:hypothetical protein